MVRLKDKIFWRNHGKFFLKELLLDIIKLSPVIDTELVFSQDQQFALAVEYSRHAELVALQIAQAKKSFPGPALRLLKLTPAGVRHVTTHYLRC